MKMIDLLNKIANGEHNFSFKYGCDEFFYDFDSKYFVDTRFKETLGERYSLDMTLNDEVEIIEEEKKITPTDFENLGYALGSIQKYINKGYDKAIEEKKIPEKLKLYAPYPECDDTRFEDVEDKINEILDYLKAKEIK